MPLLEQQRTTRVIEEIKAGLVGYIARNGFEEICRRSIAIQGDQGDLPFQPRCVGRIWNRKAEIDVAAIDEKSKCVLLGECKWTERPIGEEILTELYKKAELFPNLHHYKKHYALFSKTGFTASVKRKAATEGIALFSIKNITL